MFCLFKVSGNRFGYPVLLLFFLKGQLDSFIAICLRGLFLNHRARTGLDHRYRDQFPTAKVLAHAYFFSDNSLTHFISLHPLADVNHYAVHLRRFGFATTA